MKRIPLKTCFAASRASLLFRSVLIFAFTQFLAFTFIARSRNDSRPVHSTCMRNSGRTFCVLLNVFLERKLNNKNPLVATCVYLERDIGSNMCTQGRRDVRSSGTFSLGVSLRGCFSAGIHTLSADRELLFAQLLFGAFLIRSMRTVPGRSF